MSNSKDVKDVVISKVCHDIRNPLTSIINSLDILSEARADKDTFDKFKDIIRLSAESIAIVVKNLSAFSMIERGEFLISPKPLGISNVLHDSIKMNKIAFNMKWIDLSVDIPDGLPQVSIDADWIKQAFNNIFSFLIKFMSSKEKLSIKAEDTKGAVFIRIMDGKKSVQDDYLSEIFSEVKPNSEEASQGAWMSFGLYISKKIAQAHGGDLRVENGEGATTFVMSLPCQQVGNKG